LEELPPLERSHPRVLVLRIQIYLTLRKFEEARLIADTLAEQQPQFAFSWISLARVEATLENAKSAAAYLEKAFAIDPKVRLAALDDPLLESIWS
jgi:tetratricopeptide (TPR) repeat protein